jgi:hypothetical protein
MLISRKPVPDAEDGTMAAVTISKEEKKILDKAIAWGNYLKKNGYKDFDIDRLVLTATIQQIYGETKSAFGLVSGLLGMFKGIGDLQPPHITIEDSQPEDDKTKDFDDKGTG